MGWERTLATELANEGDGAGVEHKNTGGEPSRDATDEHDTVSLGILTCNRENGTSFIPTSHLKFPFSHYAPPAGTIPQRRCELSKKKIKNRD